MDVRGWRTVGWVVGKASGPDNGELEVLAWAGKEKLLLVVLVGENLLHHGPHENFEEEGRLRSGWRGLIMRKRQRQADRAGC
eukprot:scaffold87969_cov31-Tisochrysis_lutea.AAC.3